jgi:hypothetical protein
VISEVLFFNITQKFTNLLVQLSIFLIELFVGTFRLSSHARLEAFVIQTKLNYLTQFELTWHGHIIGGWRELDKITPHETHRTSKIMRTYHTHFGVPWGVAPGWWDDIKRYHKPMLPLYLRLDISSNLSRALSCNSPFWP